MIPSDLLKRIRRIQIRTRSMVSDVFAGHYHSAFKGQGMEFEEVREYVPGDDIRSIDWNVTARMGHPFIKKYREERELTVMLAVDISGSQQFGSIRMLKRDLAAEIAAVLAFSAIQNNDRVGLLLFTDHPEHALPPRKGSGHVLRVIRDVLYKQPEGRGTDIGQALHYLNRIHHRRTITFLISDFLDTGYESILRAYAKRHDLVAIQVTDPREHALEAVGVIAVQDPETGARMEIDTSDRATRAAYQQLQQQQREQTATFLKASGIDHLSVTTDPDSDYIHELIRLFRRREARR